MQRRVVLLLRLQPLQSLLVGVRLLEYLVEVMTHRTQKAKWGLLA